MPRVCDDCGKSYNKDKAEQYFDKHYNELSNTRMYYEEVCGGYLCGKCAVKAAYSQLDEMNQREYEYYNS